MFSRMKKMNWFQNICTEEWNLNQDAGYPLEKATNDLIKTYPNYKSYIRCITEDGKKC